MRALSKQPEERFQNIAEMRAALLDDTRVQKISPADAAVRRRLAGINSTRSLTAVPVVQPRGGVGMTIVLTLIAAGLIGWVLAGTPGIGNPEVAPTTPPTPVIARTPDADAGAIQQP